MGGTTLLFASSRTGTMGGNDIWYATPNGSGWNIYRATMPDPH